MAIQALERVALAIGDREVRKHIFRHGETRIYQDALGKAFDYGRYVAGLSAAQLFDVGNVMQWLRSMRLSGPDAFEMMAQLPSCVPPYPYTYLEWDDQGVRVGAFVVCSDKDGDGGRMALISVFDTNATVSYFLGTMVVRFNADGTVLSGPAEDDGRPTPWVEVSFEDTFAQKIAAVEAGKELDIVTPAGSLIALLQRGMARAVGITLFTFSLLHCKNVAAVEVDPRTAMNRQQIRAQERSKRPFLVYKVLKVTPLRAYRKNASEEEGEGQAKRLHHVRGHFVEYGPAYGKGLLFGRLEGRFFREYPLGKGSLPEGLVAKTYRLAPPPPKGPGSVSDLPNISGMYRRPVKGSA